MQRTHCCDKRRGRRLSLFAIAVAVFVGQTCIAGEAAGALAKAIEEHSWYLEAARKKVKEAQGDVGAAQRRHLGAAQLALARSRDPKHKGPANKLKVLLDAGRIRAADIDNLVKAATGLKPMVSSLEAARELSELKAHIANLSETVTSLSKHGERLGDLARRTQQEAKDAKRQNLSLTNDKKSLSEKLVTALAGLSISFILNVVTIAGAVLRLPNARLERRLKRLQIAEKKAALEQAGIPIDDS